MTKLKTYTVVYRAEVKKCGTIEARNEKEAREKFDKGDFEEDCDLDCYDIDDICIEEDE